MEFIRQCVGIDISKKSFTACLCKLKSDGTKLLSKVAEFSNDKPGYNQLIKWVKKNQAKGLPVCYVMEATGVYYEQLAYHLDKLKKQLSVVLPNKIKHYGKSLNVKTKTDPEDAKIISQMGSERKLSLWTSPSPMYRELRALSRLYRTLQEDKTVSINRIKQLKCSYDPLKLAVKTHKSTIQRIDKQLKDIENLMKKLLKSDTEIWAKVENILTIKGIGIKTIAIILAETQGFKLIQNQRQLISYCGLDVVSRESGSSIKGKTRISKKGNSHIRSALYFPALVASRHNKRLKEVYQNIIKNKPSKMVGMVALQRRLLILIFSLWKNDTQYIENYHKKGKSGFQEEEGSSLSSTRRVDKKENQKVDGEKPSPSTQNEHLYDQSSEALLCL